MLKRARRFVARAPLGAVVALCLLVACAQPAGSSARVASFLKAQQAARAVVASGVKTDLRVYREPPAPTLPQAGGTFTDPTFGTEIMRVTDERGCAGQTSYSYWPTFNRDSTRLLAHCADGAARVYEFDPDNFRLGSQHALPPPPPSAAGGLPTTFEDAVWSGLDPDALFVHRGAAVFAYSVARRAYRPVFDLTNQLPAGSYFFQMSVSRDDDTFAFTLRDAAYKVAGYLAFRRSARRIMHRASVRKLDEVQIDKSGRYLVVKTGEQGKGVVEARVVDLETGATEDLRDDGPDFAPGHSDNGTGVVIGGDNWTNRITARSLSSPHEVKTVLALGDDWGNDNHVSMLADDEAWALVSFFGTNKSGRFLRELVLVATDGSGRVRRLAHHRSIQRDYLDTPRANASRDGRFVAFTSNWGGRGRRDLFVLRVPAPTQTRPRRARL